MTKLAHSIRAVSLVVMIAGAACVAVFALIYLMAKVVGPVGAFCLYVFVFPAITALTAHLFILWKSRKGRGS